MEKQLGRVGDSGLEIYNGFLHTDFIDEMRGTKKYKNIEEMRLNSPIVGAGLAAIKYPIRNIEWFFVSDRGEDDPRLVLLNKAKNGLSRAWGEHILEALTAIEFGFAPLAIQYKRDGGEVLWDRFMLMGQDTVQKWDMQHGEIKNMYQWPHVYKPAIPIERILLVRLNAERNNPEGRSMLRNAFTSYYYAKELTKIEAIGKERGMAGIPSITLPEDANSDIDDPNSDASKAAEIVRNIRNDEQGGVVLPFGWNLELVNTGVNSEMAMNMTIQRHESRMLMSMLSQFIMLGLNNVGTQSKAESDMDLFNVIVDAIADIVAEAHTSQSIPRLMELNGLDTDGLRLEHSPPGDVDFIELAQAIAMIGDRITWTAEDEALVRSVFRLPRFEPVQIEQLRDEALEKAAELAEAADIERQAVRGIKPQKPTIASAENPNDYKRRGPRRPRTNYEADETPLESPEMPPYEEIRREHEERWRKTVRDYFNAANERFRNGIKGE